MFDQKKISQLKKHFRRKKRNKKTSFFNEQEEKMDGSARLPPLTTTQTVPPLQMSFLPMFPSSTRLPLLPPTTTTTILSQPMTLPSAHLNQVLIAAAAAPLPSSNLPTLSNSPGASCQINANHPYYTPMQQLGKAMLAPGCGPGDGLFPSSLPSLMFQRLARPLPNTAFGPTGLKDFTLLYPGSLLPSVESTPATKAVSSITQNPSRARIAPLDNGMQTKKVKIQDTDNTDEADSSGGEAVSREGSPNHLEATVKNTKVPSKRTKVEEEDDDEPEPINTSPSGVATAVPGERRLVINFESFGERGEIPQYYGKTGIIIPNGVVGVHTVYHEKWRFEIRHSNLHVTPKVIRLIWRVTNLTTNETTERTETVNEAKARASIGRTITNQLFREAMEQRAIWLERNLETEDNLIRLANVKSLIKVLRPNRFTQGPLVFGLQHKTVQEAMGTIVIEK